MKERAFNSCSLVLLGFCPSPRWRGSQMRCSSHQTWAVMGPMVTPHPWRARVWRAGELELVTGAGEVVTLRALRAAARLQSPVQTQNRDSQFGTAEPRPQCRSHGSKNQASDLIVCLRCSWMCSCECTSQGPAPVAPMTRELAPVTAVTRGHEDPRGGRPRHGGAAAARTRGRRAFQVRDR